MFYETKKNITRIYHPQYKGIRLDVYAKDEHNTHYNVEMQAVKKDALFRRARYYHSQIDMELLLSGAAYKELPNSYVIFICDFDPFGEEKYRYTIRNHCAETEGEVVDDGNVTIFLSTKGKNKHEVPKELISFLEFVGADLNESLEKSADDFVKSLQESIAHVKKSREMEERFMLLELMLQDEHSEGKAEGKAEDVISLLEDLSDVPETLQERIMSETNFMTLKRWLKIAAKAESIEQFIKEM